MARSADVKRDDQGIGWGAMIGGNRVAIVVRWFLAVEAAVFGGAALVHAGVLVGGYEHAAARTAESVIALVLLVGLAASVLAPGSSRGIGLGVQGFALL